MKNKTNIIFIMVDQLSAKWLEVGGNVCPTPNIDKLKKMGVNYSNAYTTNPICCAARATIATGLPARGHGVLQNGYELSPDVPNFMQILRDNDWDTSAFGKVHFLSHFRTFYPDYKPYGFDHYKITEDTRAGDWLDFVEKEYPEYYEKALSTVWSVEIPELSNYGEQKRDIAALSTEIRKNTVWPTEKFVHNNPKMYTLPFPKEMSQTEWITQNAVEHINNVKNDKAMLMHISYVQPHSPHCPPGEYMDMVNVSAIPTPIEPEWTNDKNAPKCFPDTEGAHTEIPADWQTVRQYYYADIAHLDENIGRVLDALDQSGKLENSYIIFLSDHGELLLDHGFTGKAERHYDQCIRIPLVMVGDGFDAGVTCDDMVDLLDIFPTVLKMADIPLPKRPICSFAQDSTTFEGDGKKEKKVIDKFYQGRSLLDRSAVKRDSIYVESYNNIESFTMLNWARTIRTKQFRYTFYPDNSGEQLFDMQNDPNETTNLASDENYANIKANLKDLLLNKVIEQDFPHTPNSLYMLGVH